MSREARLFKDELSLDARLGVVRCTIEVMAGAAAEAAKLAPDFAPLFIPQLRRMMMEQAIQRAVWPEGVAVRRVRAGRATFSMLETEGVLVTVVTRSEFSPYVNPYRYRKWLAEGRQLSFFDPEPPLLVKEKIFALVQFGGGWSATTPSFVTACFPSSRGYVEGERVDLLAEFHRHTSALHVVEVAPTPVVRLREQQESEGA